MATAPHDLPTITVGKLRQNPTEMIHAVRMGDEYVLTDRGVPVGRIVPFRPLQQWVPAREVRDLLATPSDPGWAAEVREARDGESPRDPWERR